MSKSTFHWFEVDKDGLSKLLSERGKSFVVNELIQNAWDTDTTKVVVNITMRKGGKTADMEVIDDDPEGFLDLSHAYTLFAESCKKDDPTKRGRFNLGEKLVLSLCREAKVESTKGTIAFLADGTRKQTRTKRERGSRFSAVIAMTTAEYNDVCEQIDLLIPPPGVTTIFNGEPLQERTPIAEFETKLNTVRANADGALRYDKRKTRVVIYEPRKGEVAAIYEMGIPVVETGDRFHVDVMQKVPVNFDRNNVSPKYLASVRAEVLNRVLEHMEDEDAGEDWVTDALSDPAISADALNKVLDARYGDNRAVFDPTDREANNRIVESGGVIIHGGAFSKGTWERIRDTGAAIPAGQLMPSESDHKNMKPIDEAKWTIAMREVASLSKMIALHCIRREVHVQMVQSNEGFEACYAKATGTLSFNVRCLGKKWFGNARINIAVVLDLIIHELGHEYSSNHLSKEFNDALTLVGGKVAAFALKQPKLFSNALDEHRFFGVPVAARTRKS